MKATKMHKINCPYCGAPAVCRPAGSVHQTLNRERSRYLYICSRWPECDAYVSAHGKDRRPMGTLANSSLRHKRILAHQALDELMHKSHMEKWAVYIWLQGKLGVDEDQAHIGMFSEQTCDQVIALCRQSLNHYAANQTDR